MGHIGRENDLSGLTNDDIIEAVVLLESEYSHIELSSLHCCLKDKTIERVEYGEPGKLVAGYQNI